MVDISRDVSLVAAALYWMELVFLGLSGALVGLAALTDWMVEGRARLLERSEGMLPLKGRWLRYLVAACLFPVVVFIPIVLCLLLALVPPVPGFCALTAALLVWFWRGMLRARSTSAHPPVHRS